MAGMCLRARASIPAMRTDLMMRPTMGPFVVR